MKIDLSSPVGILELSVRTSNCLKNAEIETVRELIQKTEINFARTRNFGKKSVAEIKEKLGRLGLRLGMSEQEIFGLDGGMATSTNYDFLGDYRLTPCKISNNLLFSLYKRESLDGQDVYRELVSFGIKTAEQLIDIFNEHISLYKAEHRDYE